MDTATSNPVHALNFGLILNGCQVDKFDFVRNGSAIYVKF